MVTVIVDELPAVTEVGLKLTVTPDGVPEADRLTDWADPVVTAVATVAVVDPPAVTEPEDGDSDTEKSLPAAVPNVNQLTLAKSAVPELVNTRKTVCTPVTLAMLAVLVTQLCQPPVGDIAMVATAALSAGP